MLKWAEQRYRAIHHLDMDYVRVPEQALSDEQKSLITQCWAFVVTDADADHALWLEATALQYDVSLATVKGILKGKLRHPR